MLRAPDESILPLPELVRSCLLLVQGIPTAGVFELDQQAFTFSANNGLKLYLEQSTGKIEMNSGLFERMMQAGSYFLHLREFADTMSAGGIDEGPGKVLQSFALAVGEFLQEYQA